MLDIKTVAKCRDLIDVYRKTDTCANETKLGGGADGSRVRKIIQSPQNWDSFASERCLLIGQGRRGHLAFVIF